MSDTTLKIAVVLAAYDKMSSVIANATSDAEKRLMELGKTKIFEGVGLFESGKKLLSSLEPAIDAFGEAQQAGNELKASMMQRGGVLDEQTYKKIYGFANEMSDKYKGSTSSYLEMVTEMKNNRINEKDILGGMGESTAKLADFFQMAPRSIAEFSAHMKNDMGVAAGEMDKLNDLIARIHQAGVGKTGEEAVTQMNEFFGKASLGAANLGVQGLEASKQMGALGALFMSRGLSGQTVGNNFRRIFDGLRDASKVNGANVVASQYGVFLDLFDKGGKFKGIDNFVAQLGKLENLKPQAIAAILKSFGGKQGLSTDFLEYLGKEGLKGFGEFNKKIEEQANLDEKLKVIMGGVNYQQGVMSTSWTNLKSSFGSSMKPVLDKFYSLMNVIIPAIRKFLDEHPRVAKFASAFIALAGAAMMLFGAIKIIQGIRVAMQLLNIVLWENPILLIVGIIIGAVALIYTYWDKIGPYFMALWAGIKQVFLAAWNYIKTLLSFTPIGIIIKHWAEIGPRVMKVVQAIINAFKGLFGFFWSIQKFLFNAGKNIITSILNGMTAMINKPYETVKKMVQKIRNLLPFSPAKDGPLRDIHKIRLVETIAESIKPNSLLNAMHRVTGSVFDIFARPVMPHSVGGAPVGGAGGGGMHFNVTINLSGGATSGDGKLIGDELEKRFKTWLDKYNGQRARVAF